MQSVLSLVNDLFSAINAWFAAGNFNGLTAAQKAEAVKSLAGFAAGVGVMPRTAGMGFVEGKLAGLPGKALPTSPENAAAGLVRWQLDMGGDIGGALSGDQAAAERAVEGVHRLGDYMAGKKD
ncbi:MAG: hypothetical protein AB1500_08315 [Bacillota bacterium]